MGLITFADCQLFDSSLTVADSPLYTQLINGATAFIEKYCKRKFDVSQKIDYDYFRNPIVLTEYPVSTCQVFIDPLGTFLPATETTAFYLDKQAGIITFSSTYWANKTPVKLVYTPSAFTVIPDDLKEACYKLVRWNKNRLDGDSVGVKSVINNTIQTNFFDSIPYEVRQVLDQYKV